jgi:uncharacterized membrane protein YagU involved in acid resistance
MTSDQFSIPRATLSKNVIRGAVAGVIGGVAMAMFAMIASLTYQHHGFFTPLFHISSSVGTPTAMMTSMQQAMAGHSYWFTPGAAILGLVIHMMTGAAYGVVFVLATQKVRRRSLVAIGAVYGLLVFAVSSFIGLPIAGALFDAGDPITHMARIVGYGTFAIEHVVYGMMLGLVLYALRRSPTREETTSPQQGQRLSA